MMIKVIPNTLTIASLVFSNVADDPTYFALQVIRRFKTKRIVNALIGGLDLCCSSARVRALSAMLLDDNAKLSGICRDWIAAGDDSRESVFLANLCIASNEWELAEALLHGESVSRRKTRSRARLLWSLGHMTEAIELLKSGPRSRQLRHYESELNSFKGLEPLLSVRSAAKKKLGSDCSVIYVATNSLPHTGSGYAQRTHSMLMSLNEMGWKVTGLTRANYPLNIGKIAAADVDLVSGIEYERCIQFPAKQDFTGRVQQQADDLLLRVLRESPDVLHTTTDFSNALAVKAVAEATGTPWVYEVRGQLADTWLSTRPEKSRDSERYRMFMEREAYVAQHADHVFTLGSAMKNNLIAAGVDDSKISLLPNGVGEKFLDTPLPREEARANLGLDPSAFYVGTVSSLVPYEGLSTVVRAVAMLAKDYVNVQLLVVGDGTDRENLISLAEELGVADRCVFPGRVPREQSHLYHSSLNAFVVPRIDSEVTRSVTPLKPVEAMACEVPVLASDLPALRELIIDGENGHLIEAGNIEHWAEAIGRLVERPELGVLMGRSGREFVLNSRTWGQNAQAIVEVYGRIISKPS